jgi:V/A-type H+-transporting ATPase subunit B
MPAEDISHPIPDLTGYITEGQVVLDHGVDHKGVFPPINVLPSLSRLMDQGIGKDYSHPDHPGLANQLYASYAKAVRVRVLASVIGRDGLTPLDLKYLDFADQFESSLIRQAGRRTLEESMAAGWTVLRRLPKNELTRLSDRQITQYIEPAATLQQGDAHA